MTTVTFKYKGSSRSGNYGHAGRPGHRGGSAPKKSAEAQWTEFKPLDDKGQEAFVRQMWPGPTHSDKRIKSYDDYLGQSYTGINRFLRGQTDPSIIPPSKKDEIDRQVQDLDALMSEHVVPENVIALRGAVMPDLVDKWDSIRPGSTFRDRGYVSTTFDPFIANKFSGQYNNTPPKGIILYRIRVPAGAHALGYMGGEREMTLPRGSTFRVVSTSKEHIVPASYTGLRGERDVYTMEVELVP